MESGFNFYRDIRQRLSSCGYKPHGEGIFTKGEEGHPSDWISISGNSYFYVASAGVVFPELSLEMRDALPVQPGMVPLDGISPSLLPFVFSPVARYIQLPPRGQNPSASSPLTSTDSLRLAECICGPLPPVLGRFHELKAAVDEVELTLETGGTKAFLLVIAYIKLGNFEAASSFAKKTLAAFKSVSTRAVYQKFLQNLGSTHDLHALLSAE